MIEVNPTRSPSSLEAVNIFLYSFFPTMFIIIKLIIHSTLFLDGGPCMVQVSQTDLKSADQKRSSFQLEQSEHLTQLFRLEQ